MARKNRRIKKSFIIIILSIVLLLTIGANLFILYKNKNSEKESLKLDKEYQTAKKNLDLEEENLTKLTSDLDNVTNIDEKIANAKKEYFENIKKLEDKILKGESNKKIAYLTFDDGPYYNTYNVLNILDKYNVKATFFTTSINGEKCFDNSKENCLKLYKEYVKRGHTIANHTFTHGIFKGLYSSKESFINALKKQEERVKEQTGGYITNIVRFPGGSATAGRLKNSIIEELRKNNYGWVDWSAEDGDGRGLNSKEEAWETFTKTIDEKIEVVLFHDYSTYTLAILPKAIEYLQNNGYILLPLFYESNVINK